MYNQGTPPIPLPLQGYNNTIQQRSKRPFCSCLILIVCISLIIVSMILCDFVITLINPQAGPSVDKTYSFSMEDSPNIIINASNGDVHLWGDTNSNTVSIDATTYTHLGTDPSALHLISAQESPDKKIITFTIKPTPPDTAVDLTIHVPDDSHLKLKLNSGKVNINGLVGQLALKSNGGSINIINTELTSSSTIQTSSGNISFDNTIDANSQFETDSGNIDIILPQKSATFHLDATANIGYITSQFPNMTETRHGLSTEMHGNVGNTPGVLLKLSVGTGSISLENDYSDN